MTTHQTTTRCCLSWRFSYLGLQVGFTLGYVVFATSSTSLSRYIGLIQLSDSEFIVNVLIVGNTVPVHITISSSDNVAELDKDNDDDDEPDEEAMEAAADIDRDRMQSDEDEIEEIGRMVLRVSGKEVALGKSALKKVSFP